MSRYICQICGFIYDEAKGMPDVGIAPGTKWEDLPADWKCPLCGATKDQFEKEAEKVAESKKIPESAIAEQLEEHTADLRELTNGEIAAICSNLARGCEKQYMNTEAALFSQIADYYMTQTSAERGEFADLQEKINADLKVAYLDANQAADKFGDRGAKRSLVWSEKVSKMMISLLAEYQKEGTTMLENTKIWVCDICGFIYIGNEVPQICPICKVPSLKILEVK